MIFEKIFKHKDHTPEPEAALELKELKLEQILDVQVLAHAEDIGAEAVDEVTGSYVYLEGVKRDFFVTAQDNQVIGTRHEDPLASLWLEERLEDGRGITLKNMATKQYLAITDDGQVWLLPDCSHEITHFLKLKERGDEHYLIQRGDYYLAVGLSVGGILGGKVYAQRGFTTDHCQFFINVKTYKTRKIIEHPGSEKAISGTIESPTYTLYSSALCV